MKRTRFAMHQELLSRQPDDRPHPDPQYERERQLMDSFDAPDLKLPNRQTKGLARTWQYSSLLAIAAATLLVVYMHPKWTSDRPALTPKGSFATIIHLEENGKIRIWNRETPVRAGTRVKIEVRATADSAFFLAVDSTAGSQLDPNHVWETRLELEGGSNGFLPTVLELDDVNQHEVLEVIRCPSPLIRGLQTDLAAYLTAEAPLPKSCDHTRWSLR